MFSDVRATPEITPQIRALQETQYAAREAFYEAINKANRSRAADVYKDIGVIGARDAYDKTVLALESALGHDVACTLVDCDLFTTFPDFFKDENGFRPGSNYTKTEVLAWIASMTNPVAA